MKVEFTNQANCKFIAELNRNTQIYPHFKLYELANNKGKTDIPQMILTPEVDEFFVLVEKFRGMIGRPFNVNSCYRQTDYNKGVGGSRNSLHLRALALDVAFPSLSYAERLTLYTGWRTITQAAGKIGGINFYSWGIHIDSNEKLFGHEQFVIRNGSNKIVDRVPITLIE